MTQTQKAYVALSIAAMQNSKRFPDASAAKYAACVKAADDLAGRLTDQEWSDANDAIDQRWLGKR